MFIDNGLLRHNEFTDVLQIYKKMSLNVIGIDSSKTFIERLSGIENPEEKRKIIGKAFIDVFANYATNKKQKTNKKQTKNKQNKQTKKTNKTNKKHKTKNKTKKRTDF